MVQENKIKVKVIDILLFVILIITLIVIFFMLKQNNLNDFSRAELYSKQSSFKRDSKVKYSNMDSYKIESKNFNDAMIHKKIQVTKNTPYKISCMVKTKNIETENNVASAGALICVADTVEQSKSISGTNDWQKLEFLVDSKNREEIDIGFRIGGNDDNAKGTVWFSDFKIEVGMEKDDNTWNIACFIIENIDITLAENQKQVKLKMTDSDIETVIGNMQRFQESFESLSNNKININYEILKVQSPLTSISYNEENGYYVSPNDVQNLIDSDVSQKEYDHIFVVVRFGDALHQEEIKAKDWIGLGGMDYYGIGFSNIRLPDSEKSYLYKYDSSINTFPEEVWVHEYLHSLERNQKEYGYSVPALHDYEKYGYQNERLVGLLNWYKDYMRKEIKDKDTGEKVGLEEEIYKHKPVHNSNFSYTYDRTDKVFIEPDNFIEQIGSIFKMIGRTLFN